jgi:penicillin-binding protein 2
MLDSGEPRGTSGVVLHLFRATTLVAFGILAAQLWRLQIVEGPQLRQRAESNRVRVSQIPPPRGVIYDRKGTIVASNAPDFVVSIVPADLPAREEGAVYERLAEIIGGETVDIRRAVDRRKAEGDLFTPISIKSSVPRDAALTIEQRHIELPGVLVSVESSRRYADGPLLAHILGYTGPISPTVLSPAEYKQKTEKEGYSINDRIGTAGLEDSYERYLRGKPGRRTYEVEASGRTVGDIRVEQPASGNNVALTIDVDLQRAVAGILREGLHQGNVGVAILSDVKSGEVLSLVSLPTYDNNIFTDDARDEELAGLLKDPEQPFFDRSISGQYPPGSTFKLVTGLGALQEGVAKRETIIESKGVLYVPHDFYPNMRQPFPDWSPLGRLNFIQAIANSSNIYFFYLGGGYEPEKFTGLGVDRLARYARMFGYGTRTKIDLPGESAGTVPDDPWKLQHVGEHWVKGDTYNMSIGQGYVEATPIQVHNMTVTIANGGTVLTPHVVREVADPDGQLLVANRREESGALQVDPRHLQTLVDGMEAGFSGQLLRDYRIPNLRVAGKTGTAEYGQGVNALGGEQTHGWFTGFAPVQDPRIAVTVFVERGSSSRDAAPIAARILRHYFEIPENAPAPPATPLPSPVPRGPGSQNGALGPANVAPAAATPRQVAPATAPAAAKPVAPTATPTARASRPATAAPAVTVAPAGAPKPPAVIAPAATVPPSTPARPTRAPTPAGVPKPPG